MLDKLRAVESRFEELEFKSGLPDFYADPNRAAKLLRERNDLEPIVSCYRDYLAAVQEQRDAEELMADPEMREFCQDDFVIYMVDGKGYEAKTLAEILPFSFSAAKHMQ